MGFLLSGMDCIYNSEHYKINVFICMIIPEKIFLFSIIFSPIQIDW